MTTAYGATPTQLFLTREAAAAAGAARVVFTTFAVGDGNGTVPSLSDQGLGLVHEVWRGSVNSVAVNGNNSQQIDINVTIPDSAGSFTIREIMVLDENGHQVVAGICNLIKPSSGIDGTSANFSFFASVLIGDTAAVTLIVPTGGFATTAWVTAGYNFNLPTAALPLNSTDTNTDGWIQRVFGINAATTAAVGSGRPATNAEFTAGAAATGTGIFQLPWPTLQQVSAAFTAAAITGSTLGGSGYIKFPSGLILQWGSGTLPVSHSQAAGLTVTFPLAFPAHCVSVTGNCTSNSNSSYGYPPVFASYAVTQTSFIAGGDLLGGNGGLISINEGANFNWMALGY